MDIIEFCDSNEIVIEVYYNDSFIEIRKSALFNFVKNNNLNDWVDDYYDPNEPDGHAQATGSYTMKQYFELPFEQIEKDILKYLKYTKND